MEEYKRKRIHICMQLSLACKLQIANVIDDILRVVTQIRADVRPRLRKNWSIRSCELYRDGLLFVSLLAQSKKKADNKLICARSLISSDAEMLECHRVTCIHFIRARGALSHGRDAAFSSHSLVKDSDVLPAGALERTRECSRDQRMWGTRRGIDTEIPIIIEIIRIPRVSRYIKATMLVAGVLLYIPSVIHGWRIIASCVCGLWENKRGSNVNYYPILILW